MKKNIIINPVGLKGNEINERMKSLMGIKPITESKSNIVVELTKLGPDGKAYAIVRENHEWYIKSAENKAGLIAEDFNYIGGLKNKKSEAYPSYAKAIKHLNLKFKSLAEAYNFEGEINVFTNDNLLSESGVAGFSSIQHGGFTGEGNLVENEECEDNMTEEVEEEEVELSEEEKAIDDMMEESDEVKGEKAPAEAAAAAEPKGEPLSESKLSILRALENMDAIIDSLTEGKVKKKVYTIK